MTGEPHVASTMLDPQMEAARELLLAAMRRHADSLPTLLLCDLRAAADELVDPTVLPTLSHADDYTEVEQMMACAHTADSSSRSNGRSPHCPVFEEPT